MPSPATPIKCEVKACDLVESSRAQDGQVLLPLSIPPGNIRYTEDGLRCHLAMPLVTSKSIPPFAAEQVVNLQATMPWIKQPLQRFGFSRTIVVQFPIELHGIKVPAALTPISAYNLRLEVCDV
jgi:hypothetical protein